MVVNELPFRVQYVARTARRRAQRPHLVEIDPQMTFWNPRDVEFRDYCALRQMWCRSNLPAEEWRFTMIREGIGRAVDFPVGRDIIYALRGRFAFATEAQAFAFKMQFG